VESIWSRATGEQAAVVSSSRIREIDGRSIAQDDPAMLVRSQRALPTTGEILASFQLGPFVAGSLRGFHRMPLMPVRLRTAASCFDGPPLVSCAAFSLHGGRLTEPVDAFDHPLWDAVRQRVAEQAIEMRRQGFAGAAMLPTPELAQSGVRERLAQLEKRFQVRARC
jgi:fructose 1,6-bisphosphate aldolase/phosphatase